MVHIPEQATLKSVHVIMKMSEWLSDCVYARDSGNPTVKSDRDTDETPYHTGNYSLICFRE